MAHPWTNVAFVSPHLDDAVLCCGATLSQLAQSGCSVSVITVFAGLPPERLSEFAHTIHRKFGLTGDAVSTRRTEDLSALRIIGAEPVHGHLLDAIYRPSRASDWQFTDNEGIFDASRPLDDGTLQATCAFVEPLLHRIRPDVVFTCSAIGGHVDHRMVVAALRCIWPPERTVYWEDLPYACTTPPEAAYGRRDFFTEAASPLAWERKREALSQYRSQFGILGTESAEFPDNVWIHARDSHGVVGLSEAGWRGTPGTYASELLV